MEYRTPYRRSIISATRERPKLGGVSGRERPALQHLGQFPSFGLVQGGRTSQRPATQRLLATRRHLLSPEADGTAGRVHSRATSACVCPRFKSRAARSRRCSSSFVSRFLLMTFSGWVMIPNRWTAREKGGKCQAFREISIIHGYDDFPVRRV